MVLRNSDSDLTVTIFDKGIQIGTALVAENGNWSFTTSALPKGEHSFTTVVTDEAGNTSDSSPPFVVTIELIDDSDADADSDSDSDSETRLTADSDSTRTAILTIRQ
ncbi:hypothetical protein KZ657_16850 [Klebsiella pneumoniae]|nr:hypothetical protein KZ657_16850 [Klebsiella pneumoniae]